MSGEQIEGTTRAVDEENYVDTRRKEQILNARERVDEWRRELYTRVKMGELSDDEATSLFGDRCREYLMVLEPLLRDFSLPYSREVYLEYELTPVEITPPEKLVQAAQAGQNRRSDPLSNSAEYELLSGDLDPVTVPMTGLRQVIETEEITASWSVHVRNTNSRQRRQEVTEQKAVFVPRETLTEAVRVADEWLQQAGIGLELGTPEADAPEDNPV